MQININKALVATNFYECDNKTDISVNNQLVAKGDDILPFITNTVDIDKETTTINIRSLVTIIGNTTGNITIDNTNIIFNNIIIESPTLYDLITKIVKLTHYGMNNGWLPSDQLSKLKVNNVQKYTDYYNGALGATP